MANERIVVFTGNLSYSVRRGIAEIDNALPGLSWLIVEHAPRKRPAQLLQSQWRNFRRNGWRWIPYQTADIMRRLAPVKGGSNTAVTLPGATFTASALRARSNVQYLNVADIHAETTLATVRGFAPDLGLSLAAPILRPPLFTLPRYGTLNLHKGKVPDYRGMPPAFWELWNDEAEVGCTVHWVDEKLDTGAIAATGTVRRDAYSTLRGLQLRLDDVGVELMRDTVRRVLSQEHVSQPQPAGGKTYRKPTLAQAASLEKKIRALQPPQPARLLKTAVSASCFHAWQLGLWRLAPPRITVLLYHRVTDDARDNLSVGVEQFDRQMGLLKQHFHVLSIEEVLAETTVRRRDKPCVCVTFDDGYLDNYTHGAQILLRHQLPAAFFVSTGLIGTDRNFPHDMRRGNDHIPLMDWPHLRAMHAHGFTIGSHTVNHIDCAAESEMTVKMELAESRDTLQSQLGLRDIILGYPYGKRTNMTPQRLELVKQAGYTGCLSAYGGANVGKVDRFNVLRRGIHWEFSDYAFLFAALGLA